MKRLLITLLLTLLIGGCAKNHQEVSFDEKTKINEGYELPIMPGTHEAMLYMVRPGVFLSAIRTDIYLDGNETSGELQGKTSGNTFLAIRVSPGRHTVQVRIPDTILLGLLKPKWNVISIDATEGDVIFVRQIPVPGPYFELELLNETDGKYYMKTFRLRNARCLKSKSLVCQ